MARIERMLFICLLLLAVAELADFGLDYQLFWSEKQVLSQTDLLIHLLILVFMSTALFLNWRIHAYRQKYEHDLGQALELAGTEQARFESIVAALGDGISIQDRDYKVIYQNERHQQLAGREATGRYCYQAYAGQETVCNHCPVEKSFLDGNVHRLQKELPAGHVASHIEIIASPLRNAAGDVVAGIELVRDVSTQQLKEKQVAVLNQELQKQTEDLKVANQELEAFSYSLAHDLRSQLTPLILGSEALMTGSRQHLDEAGQIYVDAIAQSGEKIEQIIDGMLVLARVRLEDMECARFDVSALAKEIMSSLMVAEPERRVGWEVAPSLMAWGDVRLIRIAMQNLLGNAWKYSSKNEQAQISFGTTRYQGETTFFVRDDGAGFDQAKAGDIFQPFVRLHGHDYEGSGVGLATVERIIQRHGGWVKAESSPGEGATFFFLLPEKPAVDVG